MNPIIAANGQEVTDEMVDRWCDAYERGEWPEGEHNAGPIERGVPRLGGGSAVTLSVKVSHGMKAALDARAKNEQLSTAEYVRELFADAILQT